MNINEVTIIGRAGSVPEIQNIGDAGEVKKARLNIATNEYIKDDAAPEGFRQKTWWHDIIAWNKLAIWCGEKIKPGAIIYVRGSLIYNEWTDAKTQKKMKRATIRAERIKVLRQKDMQAQTPTTVEKKANISQGSNNSEEAPF